MKGGRHRGAVIVPAAFGGGVAVLLVLVLVPNVDLAVSGWFFRPGTGFPLARLPLFAVVMGALPVLAIGATILAGLCALAGAVTRRIWFGVTPRIAVYLVTSLALGPGLLVNTVLKDNWGRARPHQILDFGGTAHFTPAVLIADQCDRNCSFPSGHAALGFWLVAFAFAVPARQRTPVVVIMLAIGALIGFMRIAQGAHFPSDVVAAALLVVGLNLVLKRLILDRKRR